jgi:hypothetical protein
MWTLMLRTWRYRCGRALRIAKILRKREGPDPALKLNPSSWYSLGSYIHRQRLQTSVKGNAFSMSSFLGCLFHAKFHQCRGGRWENISESISSRKMEIRSCLRDLEGERLGFKLMGDGSFLRQVLLPPSGSGMTGS